MIAVDTTALSLLLVPDATSYSYKTKKPIRHAKERMEALVSRISQSNDSILIPTPVLSEVLIKLSMEQIANLLAVLNVSAWFRVEAFDTVAAVELAIRTAKAIAGGDKKEGSLADWAKVKFYRQIVSIAIVNNASELISDDPHVAAIGDKWGFKITSADDLPLPPELVPPPPPE